MTAPAQLEAAIPADPETDPDEPVAALIAQQLGMALPAECVPGVRRNMALLAEHWARLRACDTADTPGG